MAERAIALQLLRDDHPGNWSRLQLEEALDDISPEAINEAIKRLTASRVIWRLDPLFGTTPCTRHLDSLGLIGV
jgi:hypothetical protein